MQCQHACELLSDYVAGDIDRALRVTIDNHLGSCPRCREEMEGLRKVWSALGEVPTVDPPPFFHENVMSRIQMEARAAEEASERKRAAWDWRSLFRPRALAYGSAAVVITIALLAGAHTTQQTVLDPIGWVVRLVHPAPVQEFALQQERAEWTPNDRGGSLVIHLRAARLNGHRNSLGYAIDIAGHHDKGTLSSEMDTIIYIPLASLPADAATVPVTLSSAANDSAQTKLVRVPIAVVTGGGTLPDTQGAATAPIAGPR